MSRGRALAMMTVPARADDALALLLHHDGFGPSVGEVLAHRSTAAAPGTLQPEGPWALDSETVLTPGPPGAWDSQTTSVSGVHRTINGYALWYEGQPPGSSIRGDVGFATSADGLAWQKFDDPATTTAELAASDPVIPRGICGPGSQQAIFQPQVEAAADGYLAVLGAFSGTRETMDLFGATSPDGSTWRCGSETPILRAEDMPGAAAGAQLGENVQASAQAERGLTDEPLYHGEPVLAIAAVDEATAAEAIEKIDIEFEPLPFVVDPIESLRPNGPNARMQGNVWVRPTAPPAAPGARGAANSAAVKR